MATKQQVLKLHAKYPDWTSVEIASLLGCSGGYVRATFERNGLSLGKKRRRRKIIVVKPAVAEVAPPKRPAPPPPRPPKPIAIDLPALRCVEVEPRHVSLLDLQQGGDCRWPYGDGPFTFCGHPAVFGSYCGPHFGLSVGTGTRIEQTAHRVSRKIA